MERARSWSKISRQWCERLLHVPGKSHFPDSFLTPCLSRALPFKAKVKRAAEMDASDVPTEVRIAKHSTHCCTQCNEHRSLIQQEKLTNAAETVVHGCDGVHGTHDLFTARLKIGVERRTGGGGGLCLSRLKRARGALRICSTALLFLRGYADGSPRPVRIFLLLTSTERC
jgi:hypothetical protein